MNPDILRALALLAVFAAMALLEAWRPRRERALSRGQRWPSNLGIVVLDNLLVRLVAPGAVLGFALLCAEKGWGLFNLVDLPWWAEVVLAAIALDGVLYLQHVMVHSVPVFWKLHRMHHSDTDFDVTTALRFHPVEILLSLGIKFLAVYLLGAPVAAVVLFEFLLSGSAMFNHANFALPRKLDAVLRFFVVTPDFHRVHHSVVPSETNSNFGFFLPWWDYLFGTYQPQPAAGHDAMEIGIDLFREPVDQRLDRLLVQPVLPGTDKYAVNRRDWD